MSGKYQEGGIEDHNLPGAERTRRACCQTSCLHREGVSRGQEMAENEVFLVLLTNPEWLPLLRPFSEIGPVSDTQWHIIP